MASTSGIEKFDVVKELQKKFGVRRVLGRIKNLVTAIDPARKLYFHIVNKHADMIVINSKVVGSSCLNYLREKQLGIETFLPLDYHKDAVLCTSVRYHGQTYPMNSYIMRKSFKYSPKILPAVKFIINNFNNLDDRDNSLESLSITDHNDGHALDSGKDQSYKNIMENEIATYFQSAEGIDSETRANLQNMLDLLSQCGQIIAKIQNGEVTDDQKTRENILKMISSGRFGITITECRNRFAASLKLKKKDTIRNFKQEHLIIGTSEIIDTLGLQAFKRVFDFVYLRIECSSQQLQIIEALNYSNSDAGIPSITAGIISGIMPEDGPYADFTNMTHLERVAGALAMLLGIWKYNPSNFVYLDVINVSKLATFMTTVCYQKKVMFSLREVFFKRRFLEAHASLMAENELQDLSPRDSVEDEEEPFHDSQEDSNLECMMFHLEL